MITRKLLLFNGTVILTNSIPNYYCPVTLALRWIFCKNDVDIFFSFAFITRRFFFQLDVKYRYTSRIQCCIRYTLYTRVYTNYRISIRKTKKLINTRFIEMKLIFTTILFQKLNSRKESRRGQFSEIVLILIQLYYRILSRSTNCNYNCLFGLTILYIVSCEQKLTNSCGEHNELLKNNYFKVVVYLHSITVV